MPALAWITHKLGPYVHRLQPKTLRGRLVLASCAFSVLGVAATFALVHFAASAQFDAFALQTARNQLAAFHAFVETEEEDVALHAADVSAAVGRHASVVVTQTAAPIWVTDRLRAGRCDAFVRLDVRGEIVTAVGPPAEVAALASFAAPSSAEDTTGLMWLGDGSSVVSRKTVLDAGGAPIGTIALARPLDAAVRSRFASLSDGLSATFRPPSASPVAANAVGGFSRVRLEAREGGRARTVVELPGVASLPAGVVELELQDARLSSSMAVAGRAALWSALLVGALGAVLGLGLATAVRMPLERTRRHLREEAPLALDGLPCRPLETRSETTSDFRRLAADVDGLLRALSRRHAELVQATQQARAAQASLRAALDGSPEGKLLVESERIVLANKAAEAILGVPLADLVGMPVADLPRRLAAFSEDGTPIGETLAEPLPDDQPVVARLDQGGDGEAWIEVTTTHLGPETPRTLLSIRDITEERRLDQMREEIFSIVSHDLRAPLTVVQGYLDILERPLQPEARRRALESARHNASKMAGLLEDLLDATAADRLLQPKNVQPIDLTALAEEVAASAATTALGHRLEVVAEARPVANGEERRLRQALMNLVTNAIKFSPEETAVTIRVEADDRVARVAVEDQGPGVPDGSRESVFERYGRLAATAEGKPGFGLGLYIVRTIAENHGGAARVEDAPGGGARFVIELPLAPAEAV